MIHLPVAVGGATGAVARFQIGVRLAGRTPGAFPWGTLAVNASGSLLLAAARRESDASVSVALSAGGVLTGAALAHRPV